MFELHAHAGRYSLPFLIYFAYSLTKGLWLNPLGNAGFWIADAVSFVLIPLLLVIAFRLPVRPCELRDDRQGAARGFWVHVVVNGFLIAFVIRMIFVISGSALGRYEIDESLILPPAVSYVGRLPVSGFLHYAGIVYLALSAALVEEYCYRFLLRQALLRHTKAAWPFIAISSITFALAHWGNGLNNMVAAFFSGMLLASAYVLARDLRVPVTGHAFYWLRLLAA